MLEVQNIFVVLKLIEENEDENDLNIRLKNFVETLANGTETLIRTTRSGMPLSVKVQ